MMFSVEIISSHDHFFKSKHLLEPIEKPANEDNER